VSSERVSFFWKHGQLEQNGTLRTPSVSMIERDAVLGVLIFRKI
jgi:hypothetical protein